MLAPLPVGFGVESDALTVQLADDLLFGGSPTRIMRLTEPGRAAWAQLQAGPVASAQSGALARKLTDAGLVHPRPPAVAPVCSLAVVIPVHDRADLLDRCLTGLGSRYPVVVVDDASTDPAAIATVAGQHGATLLRRDRNGGPAAARNTGLAQLDTDLVAFLDSDCRPDADWIDQLVGHFADPLVAAVAPRVTAVAADTWAGRYTAAQGTLDLGGQPVRVVPGTRVSYVPTAALVARRAALLDVGAAVFDAKLRVGEDVDLIWRLHEAGWRIRYDPAVQVAHHEPESWTGLLGRRFRYGTSAAPLAERHPTSMAPLVLHPWPALTVAGLLARRPLLAGGALAASVLAMRQTLRRADIPTSGLFPAMGRAVQQTWLGMGRYSTQFAAPLVAVAMLGGGRRRWGRRAALASLLLGPALTSWWPHRRSLDPAPFVVGKLADDAAYGAGVLSGCLTHRTVVPLRPVVAWRPLRIDPRPRSSATDAR